jgi:hypothetical protein
VISPAGGLVIVEVRCNFSGEGDRPDIWRPSNPGAPSAVLAYLVSGPIGSVFARGSRGARDRHQYGEGDDRYPARPSKTDIDSARDWPGRRV